MVNWEIIAGLSRRLGAVFPQRRIIFDTLPGIRFGLADSNDKSQRRCENKGATL